MGFEQDLNIRVEQNPVQKTELEKYESDGVIIGIFLYLANAADGNGVPVSDIARSAGFGTDAGVIQMIQNVLRRYGYRQVRRYEIDPITRSSIVKLRENTTQLEGLRAEYIRLINKTKMYELKAVPMNGAKDTKAIHAAQNRVQLMALELTSAAPLKDVSDDILLSQADLNELANVMSRIADCLQDLPKLRRTVSNQKRNAVPVEIDGDAVYTMQQPRRAAKPHVIMSLKDEQLSSLVLDHMNARNGGYNFGLGDESLSAQMPTDDPSLIGYAVAEPDEADDGSMWN